MAITISQQPDNIHSVFIPNFYTYVTNTTISENFFYNYSIKDINGEAFKGYTIPLENNVSFNNPNEILKNKTQFNFNPSCYEFENIPNNCYVYNEEIVEFNSVTYSTSQTKTAFRFNEENYNIEDNLLNSGGVRNFLTNMPNTHKIRYDDEFTLRTYNGNINSTSGSNSGDIYTFKIELNVYNTNAQTLIGYIRIDNPYYNSTASSLNSPTVSGDNFMIEVGLGIKNLINVELGLVSYVNNGAEVDFNNEEVESFMSVDSDGVADFGYLDELGNFTGKLISYKIHTLDQSGTIISNPYIFNYHDDCRFDSVNVAWENNKGGVDYHLFTKANEKNITSSKISYEKNNHILNGSIVESLDFHETVTVYRNKVSTFIELNTDWLNQEEINGMEDIYHSTNVYIQYEGEWRYVLNTAKKAIIYNKKRKGLKKYKLNFELSSKNYRY